MKKYNKFTKAIAIAVIRLKQENPEDKFKKLFDGKVIYSDKLDEKFVLYNCYNNTMQFLDLNGFFFNSSRIYNCEKDTAEKIADRIVHEYYRTAKLRQLLNKYKEMLKIEADIVED